MRPHRRQPTRLPCPWDSPGKNTGVGCHFLLQCMKVKSENEVAQSCPTLSNPMDCSLTGSSVHGIFQARVLEWGAIALSALNFYHPLNGLLSNLPVYGEMGLLTGKHTFKHCLEIQTHFHFCWVTFLWGRKFQFNPSLAIYFVVLSAKYWALWGLWFPWTHRNDGDVSSQPG